MSARTVERAEGFPVSTVFVPAPVHGERTEGFPASAVAE
jgi:hypothetical protein